jgi:hypothetical protein
MAIADASSAVVAEYEIFKNDANALSFFLHRHSMLDLNAPDGPFWFMIQNNNIIAGTENGYAMFESVKSDLIEIAKKRGVIALYEFEDQEIYRVTPCYLSDGF